MVEIDVRSLFADVKDFDPDDTILRIIVHNDAGANFLGFRHFRIA